MPRLLYICVEGSPFITRGSRVLGTVLDTGWDCDILIPAGALGRANVARDMGRDLTGLVRIHEFPIRRDATGRVIQLVRGDGYFGTAELEQTLVDLLRREHYAALMVKESSPLGRVFGALRRTGLDVPVVCEMVEPRVPQVYDSLITYGTWRTRVAGSARFVLPRLKATERRWLPRCDRIFTVVEEMQAYLLQHYLIDPARISVVHNAEVLSAFDAIDEPGVPDRHGTLRISHVGTFGPHRGVEVLIEAVRLVAARTQVPFRLAVVGPPAAQVARLQTLCAEKGVADKVDLIPFVPHRVAMQWIKQSDIGVIPHADTEGIRTTIPFKLFQYMSAGVMCIVSDVGGLGRIVRETGCGATFPAADPSALADEIVRAIEHPSQRHDAGARGRDTAEHRYRWELESEEYVRWLRSVKSAASTDVSSVETAPPPSRQSSARC